MIAILGFSINVQAQQSVSDFLLTAYEDQNLRSYDTRIDFLKPGNYRLPVVDEVEVRISNDEQTYEDLEYAVRLRPANPWKVRRNKALFNATKKELQLQKKIEYKENMLFRYETALNLFYYQDLADNIQNRLDLISRKSDIMQENLKSDLFDAKDFSEAKLDQVKAIENVEEAVVKANYARLQIQLMLNAASLDWQTFNLISVETVEAVADSISHKAVQSTELDLIAQELEVARQQTRVRKADFDIGFAQMEYYPFTNKDSKYGFSVGVTLPIFKDNKPKIAEDKLDELELRDTYNFEQQQDSVAKIREYQYLKKLIKQYGKVLEQKKSLNFSTMETNVAQSDDFNPITVLELREGMQKLEEVVLKSKYRVLTQFVVFLYTYDAISEHPLVNYLSEERFVIK